MKVALWSLFALSLATSTWAADELPAPKSTSAATTKYEKDMAEARNRFLTETEKIKKTYLGELTEAHGLAVKRSDLAEAQVILSAMTKLQEELRNYRPAALSITFAKGTRWVGTNSHAGKPYPASLTITSRDGNQFSAVLEWNVTGTGHVIAQVSGRGAGDEITFDLNKVQQGSNVILPVVYTGKLDGKALRGTWQTPDKKTSGEFGYTLQPR